jgi:PAS domain S-box-containing protein
VATAVLLDGVLVEANDPFLRALGLGPGEAAGRRLESLVPPDQGPLPTPSPGSVQSYRTSLGGIPARVDLAAAAAGRAGAEGLVTAVLAPQLADPDTAASRALLALSRGLAEARTVDELVQALARALEVLFPARSFCIRLVDPTTFALTTLHARGRLRASARGRLALRRAAARRTGLPEEALTARGIRLTERDEPMFEGCERAMAVPLAVGGALYGILDLEYEPGSPGEPEADAPLLLQLANHAALAVRNLRSLEDANYLKTYLEDLIEHANALIAVVNRHREVIVWNAALVKLTGFGRDEVVGGDVLDLVPEEERVRFEKVLLDGFGGGRVDGFELRLVRKAGGEIRVAVNTAPIQGASGAMEGVIAIGQDLTRLRSLEAAAEHAERLAGIGRLAAGVVHELNNPLTAVTMYSDSLIEKLTLAGRDPADVEKLRAIKESALRIQRLARDLTSYARPSGARTEPCSLPELIEEAERMAKPALKEGNATVRRSFEEVPEVEGNRASLVQVFVNLITNAAQAMREGGGTIDLTLAPQGDAVRAVVADDGSGMLPEVEARLFEPFFTTRPGRGIGLGLPIVQGIVQRHGGAIAVATAPDRGTTVTLTLPVKRHA